MRFLTRLIVIPLPPRGRSGSRPNSSPSSRGNRRRWPRTSGRPASSPQRWRARPQHPATHRNGLHPRSRHERRDRNTCRRASISATSLNENGRSEGARNGQTDDNGMFEFRDLPAGRWTLRATKTGYIEQQFGQRSAFATTDPIVLAEGQQFVADFRLSRGGAIAGRVVDEFGDPLAGANVTALRIQNTAQGVRTTRTGTCSQRRQRRVSDLQPAARSVLRFGQRSICAENDRPQSRRGPGK